MLDASYPIMVSIIVIIIVVVLISLDPVIQTVYPKQEKGTRQ